VADSGFPTSIQSSIIIFSLHLIDYTLLPVREKNSKKWSKKNRVITQTETKQHQKKMILDNQSEISLQPLETFLCTLGSAPAF